MNLSLNLGTKTAESTLQSYTVYADSEALIKCYSTALFARNTNTNSHKLLYRELTLIVVCLFNIP